MLLLKWPRVGSRVLAPARAHGWSGRDAEREGFTPSPPVYVFKSKTFLRDKNVCNCDLVRQGVRPGTGPLLPRYSAEAGAVGTGANGRGCAPAG